MDVGNIQDLVKRYFENKDFITNEESTKMALIVPFIRYLGYDPNSPKEVRLEYSAEFTQGDGKKSPDRIDFAIFDKTGAKALMIIEAKPLGTDLQSRSPQLARYIAQMPYLRFGIMTDGCRFLFYGDLESPNQMDSKPFFSFSLDDPKGDWEAIGKELAKFSRDAFNADTLITEAENARYRQAMIERLSKALKEPADHPKFLSWLVGGGVYKGTKTKGVLKRLGKVAKEAIYPALGRVMSEEFIEKIKEGMVRSWDGTSDEPKTESDETASVEASDADIPPEDEPQTGIVTTAEEIKFLETVKAICAKAGVAPDDLLSKDTTNYFNVSYLKPTRWFVRLFGDKRRQCITTLVPLEKAKALCEGYEVDTPPPGFGVSRIYIESVAQTWALQSVIMRSLEILKSPKQTPEEG